MNVRFSVSFIIHLLRHCRCFNQVCEEIPKSVLYYGWFFSETTSNSLRKLAGTYLNECLGIHQFQRWMETACANHEITGMPEPYMQ